DRETELERPARTVALPERHLARLAWRRRHEDPIVGDLLDAPCRRAEHEGLADPALEHHFFVELADARRARSGASEEDAVEAAVGDRSAVCDGDTPRALPRHDCSGHAIPCDARTELCEFVRWVTARQHVE